MKSARTSLLVVSTVMILACGSASDGPASSSGTGGRAAGGKGNTGVASAGDSGSGASGGNETGGSNSSDSGGSTASTKTSTSGGATVGGSSGGNAGTSGGSGGTANGGTSASMTVRPGPFMLGADISSIDEAMDLGTTYEDTDGQAKSIFEILRNHGFNYVRLRAFVDPSAPYGYAYGSGGTCIKSATYCDTAHTVAFAKKAKDAGFGIVLDLHYSDTWADPGKQIIPLAWRGAASVDALAAQVSSYTQGIVSAMIGAGARPDVVQVGNETTNGMLKDLPTATTDCWGNNVSPNAIGGSTSNWASLGSLLKAGIDGVKLVDGSIRVMVHLENTKSAASVLSWVTSARNQGANFDILGLSCYTVFQGTQEVWKAAFNGVANAYPNMSFVIAEYSGARTDANLLMYGMTNGKGLGTFIWEPTQSGAWGKSLFTRNGTVMRANVADFVEFDSIAATVGLK